MTEQAVRKDNALLLRFKAEDGPAGLSRETAEELATRLGLNLTGFLHMAMKRLQADMTPGAERGEDDDAVLAEGDLTLDELPGPNILDRIAQAKQNPAA